MKKSRNLSLLIFTLYLLSCTHDHDVELFHKFPDQVWRRFTILQYEIPIESKQTSYDITFFIHLTKNYDYDYLDFNMIMTTPSGEERINEYHINIKGTGGTFLSQWKNDSCELTIPLKKSILLNKGLLMIQIENLVPRLETKGLLGAGIRLHQLR